jgi:UDPglucose--hexose-1-phosphate uridylyltransferase
VRVVPNKYPALDDSERTSSEPELEGRTPAAPFELLPGLGVHEIIIESPRHLESITELSDSQVTEVLETYGQRLNSLREAKKYQSAIIFKNGGPTAGATLVHLHSQLLAFQIGAPMVGQRLPLFQSYANRFGNCPLYQIAGEISTDQELIVGMTPNFFAFCPFASRFANEMWIAPRQHAANFSEMRSEDLPELAILLRSALVKLERIVKLPAYNYIVHTAPFDTFGSDHYHWHIEILPRTSRLAGFELGTSCYINTVSPERAARMLREA